MIDPFYVRTDQASLARPVEAAFATETELQDLIAANPDLLCGTKLTPAHPRRWILIRDEQKMRAAGTVWRVDLLFIDQDAVPTIVEVKRGTNPQIRREVNGQMIEYAAHASNWQAEDLRGVFESISNDSSRALATLVGKPLDEEGLDAFWSQVQANLSNKRLRLIWATDALPEATLGVVEFLNEQMPSIEAVAIEIKRFISGDVEIIVPRIAQRSAVPDLPRFSYSPQHPFSSPTKRSPSPNRPQTDEAITPEVLLSLIPEHAREAVSKIFELAHKHNAVFKPGKRELIIGFNSPAWRGVVNLMWFTQDGGISNAWGRNATFGYGGGSFNKTAPGPILKDVLTRWGETVTAFPHAEIRGTPSEYSKLWEFEYEAVVEQCDNICDRLQEVIEELSALPRE